MNKILWLRAESRAHERRTPLIPLHAGVLVRNGFQVCVESSDTRVFDDSAYVDEGCTLVANGSWRFAPRDALIFGLKELPDATFALRHRHMYFAHAYERQQGSRKLLERFKRGGGFLYDLEQIKDSFGAQLVTGGAGYLAGMAAAVACLDIRKQKESGIAPAYRVPTQFMSVNELVAYARSVASDGVRMPRTLIIGHRGKSGSGVMHLLDAVGLRYDCSPKITQQQPEFRKTLHEYELIFNCIKLTAETPVFLSDAMIPAHSKIRLIGDISCEATHPRNPFPLYSSPTSFAAPVCRTKSGIDIMAIDNITAMLPVECSEMLSEQIFPYLCYFMLSNGNFGVSPFKRVVDAFKSACDDLPIPSSAASQLFRSTS
jgi:saccharopine dehydrogenase (NAD+, L-lysine forming)